MSEIKIRIEVNGHIDTWNIQVESEEGAQQVAAALKMMASAFQAGYDQSLIRLRKRGWQEEKKELLAKREKPQEAP